jgi:hypothetical protein
MNRRGFIRKLIVGSAFAVPVVASFEMLASPSADGTTTCTSANGGSGTSGSGTTGGAGGTRKNSSSTTGTCGGTPDGGTGGAGGTTLSSDRDIKTAITPVVWA